MSLTTESILNARADRWKVGCRPFVFGVALIDKVAVFDAVTVRHRLAIDIGFLGDGADLGGGDVGGRREGGEGECGTARGRW